MKTLIYTDQKWLQQQPFSLNQEQRQNIKTYFEQDTISNLFQDAYSPAEARDISEAEIIISQQFSGDPAILLSALIKLPAGNGTITYRLGDIVESLNF